MDNKTGYFNSDEFKRMQKQLDRVAKLTESNRKWLKQVNLAYNPVFNQVNTVNRTINSAIKTAGISQLDTKRNNEFYRNILKGIPYTNSSIALGTRNQLLNNYRFIQNSPSVIRATQSINTHTFAYDPNLKAINKVLGKNIKLATSFNTIANLIGTPSQKLTTFQKENFKKLLSQQPFKNFYTPYPYSFGKTANDGYQHSDPLNDVDINVGRNPSNNRQRENVISKQPVDYLGDDIKEAKKFAENIPDNKITPDIGSFDITMFWVYIKSIFAFIMDVKGEYEAIQFLIGIFNFILELFKKIN
ncbi:hypothetical protein [Lentilactobacillus senioris]|uniref:hypothetical protein n=1 Tax=Lentilactobacillus senioris TaxID=931534 RepID=UPI003D267FDA